MNDLRESNKRNASVDQNVKGSYTVLKNEKEKNNNKTVRIFFPEESKTIYRRISPQKRESSRTPEVGMVKEDIR